MGRGGDEFAVGHSKELLSHMIVPFACGLRYDEGSHLGAQTVRRGGVGPVRSLLGGKPHRPLFLQILPRLRLLGRSGGSFQHLLCLAEKDFGVEPVVPVVAKDLAAFHFRNLR